MSQVRLDREAKQEIQESAAWYESRSKGLGSLFLDEVADSISRIAQHPLMYAKVLDVERAAELGVRRAPLRRFQHVVIYVPLGGVDEDRVVREVRILAVCHTRQLPGYWAIRMRLLK